MARATEFRRELNKLFARRVAALSVILEKKRSGALPTLKKTHVRKTIKRLQQLVSDSLARDLAKKEFYHAVTQRKQWHVKRGKGWTYRNRKRKFGDWFDQKISRKTCIYIVWKKRKCLYVGKTTTGQGRIASHFDKRWFSGATRLDIYGTRGRRYLPALECVAIHRFQPSINRFKAESRRWTRKCPLCKIHREIDSELRYVFRLR